MSQSKPAIEIEVTVSRPRKPSIQAQLGLELPDPKQARKDVYEYFKAYRLCKQLLGRDIVEHTKSQPAKPGYVNAMDPDLIRTPKVHTPAPRGWTDDDDDMLSPQERKWLEFVRRVDKKVNRLTDYQRDIIRLRFLGKEPLPSDTEVHMKLTAQGWYVSERYYDEQKAQAVQRLAASLRAAEGVV